MHCVRLTETYLHIIALLLILIATVVLICKSLSPESLAIFKKRLKHISSIFIWPSNSSTLF